ncbi:MAG: hypothetical protein E7647_00640 [Ruminococcaceae bacterium]|nr:hypothetical protein [Oscillospiraceae bacterium]
MMTDIKIYSRESIRFRSVFAACIFFAVTLSVFAGLSLETYENCIILPRSPFREGDFFGGVIRICFWDFAAFWILSLPLTKTLTVTVSSLVFFFRGMVIGNGCRVFFENSVTAAAAVILLSYIAVTLFLVIYDAFLNTNGERGRLCRLLSCLIATGACCLVRILPMLLIK